MIPDPQKREILNDFGEVAKTIIQNDGPIETITKLEKGRLNLLRMWANNWTVILKILIIYFLTA